MGLGSEAQRGPGQLPSSYAGYRWEEKLGAGRAVPMSGREAAIRLD